MTHLLQSHVDPNRRSCILLCFSSALALALALMATQAGAAEPKQKLETLQSLDVPQGKICIRRSVEPAEPKGFEPFVLTIEIEGPEGLNIKDDDVSGNYGDFNVELLDEVRRDDEASDVVVRRWTLYPAKRGELILPPIPLQASVADADNQSTPVLLLAPPLKLTVPESDAAPKSVDDIQLDLTRVSQTPWLLILAAAALFAMSAFLALFLRRKKNADADAGLVQELPYDKAIRRLNELKDSRTYLENQPEFYVEIDEILREFIAGAFAVNAQEKTSSELLAILNADADSTPDALLELTPLDDADPANRPTDCEKRQIALGVLSGTAIRARLEEIFAALELIKFAKRPTTFDDASEIYSSARGVVEESYPLYEERLTEFRRRLEAALQAAQADTDAPPQQ